MEDRKIAPTSASGLKQLVLLALVLGLGALCIHHFSKTPTAKATLSELELRDGRMWRKGQSVPFTGLLLENYQTNQLKSRSEMNDGVMNGVSEGWHTNGQLAIVEHFKKGISDGARTKWHANGQKQSEATIVGGKIGGVFRRWAEDGTLQEEIEMKQGNPDGLSRAFYPSGFVKVEAIFREGKMESQKTWKDGERSLQR